MSEEAIIEDLWDSVRAKYNPEREMRKTAQLTLQYIEMMRPSTMSETEVIIEEMKKARSQFDKANEYLKASKDLTVWDKQTIEEYEAKVKEAWSDIIEEVEHVLPEKTKLLEEARDLPVQEFIEKLGLSKEEVEQYFREEIDLLHKAEGKSDYPSRYAYIGRAVRLNDENEIEIIDEKRAKDLIIEQFLSIDFGDLKEYKENLSMALYGTYGIKGETRGYIERLVECRDKFGSYDYTPATNTTKAGNDKSSASEPVETLHEDSSTTTVDDYRDDDYGGDMEEEKTEISDEGISVELTDLSDEAIMAKAEEFESRK